MFHDVQETSLRRAGAGLGQDDLVRLDWHSILLARLGENFLCLLHLRSAEREVRWEPCYDVSTLPGNQPPGRLREPEEDDGANTDHGGDGDEVERVVTESIGQA